MNVREMARQYLEEHGCDGLRHPLLDCWCSLEMCERCSMIMVCVPARRVDGMLVPVPDDQLGPTRQEREVQVLREALVGLVGSKDPLELTQMAVMIGLSPVPEKTKETVLRAIHTLLRKGGIYEG